MGQLLFSLCLTSFIILSRALIIFMGGSFFSGSYLSGMLISFIPNFFFVYLISFLLFSPQKEEPKTKKQKKKAAQFQDVPQAQVIGGVSLLTLFYFSMLSTFFYESVFTELPSKAVFFYLGQLKHLSSSLGANAPILIIILALSLFITLGLFLRNKLKEKNQQLPMKNLIFIPVLFVATIALHISTSNFNGKLYSGSRHALLHLTGQIFDKSSSPTVKSAGADFSKVKVFQEAIGQIPPRGSQKPQAPFCEDRDYVTSVKNPRSVILLVVEGLGMDQLNKKIKGRYVAPHFRKVLSENLTFNRFLAAGSKSSHALPALFSGLPPQPHANILWVIPPPRVRGIPNILNKNGYRTSYFHGSDLSFEHQREFLKRVGFKDIIEYDPSKSEKRYGWGYDDGTMYGKLKGWINQNNSNPYFTTLFTLSTHDPYVLPQSWKPVFVDSNKKLEEGDDWFAIWKGNDAGKEMAAWESYAYADSEFKKFYDWYEKNEKAKGTLLVIVGDHYPYYIERGGSDHNKFRVPLSIVGLPKKDVSRYAQFAGRRGAQYDFPATLAHLLEYDRHPCDQGLNLFSPKEKWPKDRTIYSIGGENHEKMYLWKNRGEGFFNKSKKTLTLIGLEQFGELKKEEYKPFLMGMKGFIEAMSPLQAYAINNNAFFPPDELDRQTLRALNEVDRPIFVSHRGNTEGPGTPKDENSFKALEKVAASPFKWVELDIQITSDAIPILNHDPTYVHKGMEHYIFRSSLAELKRIPQFKNVLTLEEVLKRYSGKLNFLIEAKTQKHVSASHDLGRKIPELIIKYAGNSKVIIDSFSTHLITTIKLYCDCSTGWDTTFQKPVTDDMLNFALEMKMDWIYIHHKVLTTDLMKRAHAKGLKVMVYTANTKADLSGSSIKPDGVITDTKELMINY